MDDDLASIDPLAPFRWHPEPELIGIRDASVSRQALERAGRATWDASLDWLYDEAMVNRPEDERAPILLDLMEAVTESAGEIWLLQPTTLLAGSEDVAGFHWSLRGQPDFRGTGMRAG